MRRTGLAVALVAACGDGGGASGVAASKTLGELSDAELSRVCGAVDARYLDFERAFVSMTCTQQARSAPSTCSSARQQCIASTDPEGSLAGTVSFECEGTTSSITVSCAQITVAELNACMEDIVAGVDALAEKYTCTSAEGELQPPAAPSSCTSLGERCPMFANFHAN
jgi:hypothetical protein